MPIFTLSAFIYLYKLARMIYNKVSKLLNKLKRRRVITWAILASICGFVVVHSPWCPDLYFLHWGPFENVSCHYIETDETLPRADSATFLPPERSIFFHETSCKGDLNSRQACAVESAARAYPDWQINVLFAAPVTRFALRTGSLAVLRSYPNVNLSRVHVVKYARRTPLESMVANGALNRTRWRISHTSDVLRYLSLYKFGGVYLDLDVVVAKAMDPQARNWAARESEDAVAAGALAFSRDEIGRTMAEAAIRDLEKNYRGDIWGNNGPGVITRILKKRCSTRKLSQMSAATCSGFEVYGQQFFYPVVYWNASQYFLPGEVKGDDVAYVHHVWNQLSSEYPVDENSPYAKLARMYCPNVFKLYDKNFGI